MRTMRGIAALVGASLLLALGPALGAHAQTSASAPTVRVLKLDGVVDPFIASYLKKGIEGAARDGDAAVVIQINTPGGLDSSMRTIVGAILASPVPVLCWTGPSGARAASAGTFIMMACPQNAMAHGTNIGSAHPVGVSGAIEQGKVTNDAVGFIRSLASRNGYNEPWAEAAVRQSDNLSAEDAHSKDPKVTKWLATSVPDFLRQVSDTENVPVSDGNAHVTLHVAGATLQEESPGLGVSLLHSLIDPNLTFVFFYLGIILIVVELLHPGISVPGVCLVLGGLLLFDPSVPDLRVSRWLLVVVPSVVVAFFAVTVQAALEARRKPPMLGVDLLFGEEGVALSELNPRGEVRVGHERWSADAVGASIAAGTTVRVVGRSGLKLQVVADPNQVGGAPVAPSVQAPDTTEQR